MPAYRFIAPSQRTHEWPVRPLARRLPCAAHGRFGREGGGSGSPSSRSGSRASLHVVRSTEAAARAHGHGGPLRRRCRRRGGRAASGAARSAPRTARGGSRAPREPCGGAAPPTTLAEFTLDGSGGLDFFDVSLVDGYNLPMLVTPVAGGANAAPGGSTPAAGGKRAATECAAVEAAADGGGPAVACRSASEAFGDAQYCCSGAYGSPSACRPSVYSEFFKSACPRAYSYAYDDATPTFTCAAGATDYAITFCPAAPTSYLLIVKHLELLDDDDDDEHLLWIKFVGADHRLQKKMMQVAFPEEASSPAFSLLFMFRCEDKVRQGLAPKEGADEERV
ncbi:hypothetical protein ACP70R_020625 [Stipagrostis hirtigluma subsp. patula]